MEEPLDDGEYRAENRKMFHVLWERAKTEDYDGLDDEQRRIAESLKLHADEYHNVFEFADVAEEREFDPEDEDAVNPYMHISIHAAVMGQLEEKAPLEVFQFYNAMRKRKYPHHDTLHLIGAILAPLMFGAMQRLMPFDDDRYVQLLRKYKTRKPEKVWDLLEEDLHVADDALDEIFGDGEGPCVACGADEAVDDMGFCEPCSEKFERDMLRHRRWKYSLTAAYTPEEEYENLRRDTIEQFGPDLELLDESDLEMFDDPEGSDAGMKDG